MFDGGFNYHVFKDYNISFDEKQNTYGTVRLAQWVKPGEEPDINKAKVEIRKMLVKPEGEQPMKGIAITPDATNDLADGLVEVGFGHTKNILKSVSKREDFKDSIDHINDNDEGDDDGEMFDMRDLLLGISPSEDEVTEDDE